MMRKDTTQVIPVPEMLTVPDRRQVLKSSGSIELVNTDTQNLPARLLGAHRRWIALCRDVASTL